MLVLSFMKMNICIFYLFLLANTLIFLTFYNFI